MSKKVLITGASGLLGRKVVEAFQHKKWDIVGTGLSRASPPSIIKLDLGDLEAVSNVLQEVKPQVVVHCAANRYPDKCDNDPAGTLALNVTATSSLASLCASQSILLLYISTDYVFPGTPGDAPYQTTDAPKPPNFYGQTKSDGEKAVLEAYEKAGKEGWGVVLRVPILYGEGTNEESAVNVLMDAVMGQKEGKVTKVDDWALRYPTNTEDVGRVLQDIATVYLATYYDKKSKEVLPTILQFSSEDKYTKWQIVQLFADIMGQPLDSLVANSEGNDPNASVQRPYDCHLSSQSIKDIGIDVSTQDFVGWWRREVRAFRH